MSSPFDNIIQVQQKILKESKRSLESEKLQLWSYKADLNTTSISLKRFQSQIEIQEQKFYQLNEEARISVHELEYTTEVLSPHILSLVLQIKNPWKIIRDVCGGISQILGFTDTSWEGFQKIVKDFEGLKESIKKFNAREVHEDVLISLNEITKKYGDGLKARNGKIPEEFSILVNWFLHAQNAAEKYGETKKTLESLAKLNAKHNVQYLEVMEITNVIKTINGKICNLLECIDICENVMKRAKTGRNTDSFEVDILRAELGNCENIVKRCRGQKELVVEDTPVSILVDSLFISQCYSPEPRILEYKQYSEESFEMPTQRNYPISGNTLENTFSEPSENKKVAVKNSKKCCGLLLH